MPDGWTTPSTDPTERPPPREAGLSPDLHGLWAYFRDQAGGTLLALRRDLSTD
jgi:hypothetical protein